MVDTLSTRARRLFQEEPIAWLCAPLIAVAIAALFVGLGARPFWVDESIAVMPAQNIHVDGMPTSPYDLDFMPFQLKYGLWDPATPLYRYCLAAFTAVTGFNEFTTRSFSILMGLLAAIPLFALARKLYNTRTAVLTVTFLIVSPTFALFAREARHYTFVHFVSLCALYYLHRVTEDREGDRAPALWFVFVVATLLSQTLGYALVPLAGIYILRNGIRRFVQWRLWPWYLVAGGVYLAVMAVFWETLPFFHMTSCENRPAGCQDSIFWYLPVLYEFLSPMTERHAWLFADDLSLPPFLFIAGVYLGLRHVRGPDERPQRWLVGLWFFVPFLLLSTQDVKFPRYLFMWVMPPCALFVAVAVDRITRWKRVRRFQTAAAAVMVALVVISPRLALAEFEYWPWSMRSGLFIYVQQELRDPPRDNWERMRWQADYLEERMGPDDEVVTSFDDAGLQWYLGRFVYSFLNSKRTDAFFNELIDETAAKGGRVWFIDTLPKHNFCLSDEAEARSVDCYEKFAGFYERCLLSSCDTDPVCMHVPVD